MKTLRERKMGLKPTALTVLDIISLSGSSERIDKYYLYNKLSHLWPKTIDDAIFQLQMHKLIEFTKNGYEPRGL